MMLQKVSKKKNRASRWKIACKVFLPIAFFMLPLCMEAQFIDNVIDFLTIHPNKKAVAVDSEVYPAKSILTPIVSYAPETNLSFGLGMKNLFKLRGSGDDTRTSNIPISLQYTIDQKYQFYSGYQIFFPQERYILAGNLKVQSFPSRFFGIGKDTPNSNKEAFVYSQVLFEPIFLRNFFIPNLYLGSGFRYNRIANVDAPEDGLLESSDQAGALGSTSSGIQLAFMYDSRDNLLNAKKGIYVGFTHGFYGPFLGGSQEYQLSRLDLRYYLDNFLNSKSVLAFQFKAHFSHGDTPLQEMGRLGGDETLRGYFEGRFTDRHLIVGQLEWRQRLTPRWGITVFTGAGGVAAKVNEFSLDTLRPVLGLGLRFLIDDVEDLNLRFDFGLGQQSRKYYFKIAEAF